MFSSQDFKTKLEIQKEAVPLCYNGSITVFYIGDTLPHSIWSITSRIVKIRGFEELQTRKSQAKLLCYQTVF